MNELGVRILFMALGLAGTLCALAAEPTNTTVAEHRAAKIIGMTVQTPAGDSIGAVKDIILDNNGIATHMVVAYGGALGVGSKLAAVPWSTAVSLMKGSRIVVDRSRLERAPTFEDNKWPDVASRGWSAGADNYWQGEIRSAIAPPEAETDSPDRSRRRRDRD
jgi:sporulation protein YlmC with PRC-barrel domain